MENLKQYKKDLRAAIGRAKSAERKEILSDYLKSIERVERARNKEARRIGADISDLKIEPVKYLRNIRRGSIVTMTRQGKEIKETAVEMEKAAEVTIENLQKQFERIIDNTRTYATEYAHNWEGGRSAKEGDEAAHRIIADNAQMIDEIIENAVNRMGKVAVERRINGAYGDNFVYEVERIIYGIYDDIYKAKNNGKSAWNAAVGKLREALA